MGAIVVKVCDTNYFIPRSSLLDFQIVKGYSCLDYVVLVGGIVKFRECKRPGLALFALIPYFELGSVGEVLRVLQQRMLDGGTW
jgi:hypothetical protein